MELYLGTLEILLVFCLLFSCCYMFPINYSYLKMVDIFPISNSTLPLGIDTIQIRFSKPMFGAYGIRPLDDKRISPPYTDYQPFWKDKYTFCIILDRSKLEKGKTYGFKLNRAFFQSEKTYPMKEDFPYTFKMPDE